MIVEDEALFAMSLRITFKSWGYEVYEATPVSDSVFTEVKQVNPDLILMDINLKGNTDGIELAKQIHEHFPVPIVFMTGYDDEQTKKRAEQIPNSRLLNKPVEMDMLKETAEGILH